MVIMASSISRGRVRATTTATTESRNMAAITERRLNLLSWIFFWLGPLDSGVDERTNVKEKSREQELTGTEVARKIAKESGRMAF